MCHGAARDSILGAGQVHQVDLAHDGVHQAPATATAFRPGGGTHGPGLRAREGEDGVRARRLVVHFGAGRVAVQLTQPQQRRDLLIASDSGHGGSLHEGPIRRVFAHAEGSRGGGGGLERGGRQQQVAHFLQKHLHVAHLVAVHRRLLVRLGPFLLFGSSTSTGGQQAMADAGDQAYQGVLLASCCSGRGRGGGGGRAATWWAHELADHGVRLARARLAIGEQGAVEASQRIRHQRSAQGRVNVLLGGGVRLVPGRTGAP
mmetsp:Transcript_26419/g.49546  ORF Transcript_26419/g.49546 Transcript_26419/m.49546 type:complete len:260 (-) Transcript_26419:397-1176(-)